MSTDPNALPNAFKAALGSWASGVAVVSAQHGAHPEGTTVSSFTSLSLDPPLVLVCLAPTARVVEVIRAGNRFAISVLAADQEAASKHFATRGRAPDAGFGDIPLRRAPDAQPLVAGAAAHLACRLEAVIPQGDHHIFIGRVEHAAADERRPPLLYFRRGYRTLAD
jgi:flavin reductase (DIM6/NTAB) family NADH-FMN oxidoreductase RutF